MASRDAGMMIAALKYAGVGFQFVTEAGLCALAGWWADRKFDTSPWFISAGAMFGVTIATISLVRSLDRLEKKPGTTERVKDEDQRS